MKFSKQLILKDGRNCILRNANQMDASDFVEYFRTVHSETDFLTTYPDEFKATTGEVAQNLKQKVDSETDIEICAFIDGKLIGSAGISTIAPCDKTKHRAEFGISIMKDYWSLGIGMAMTEYCIECARQAGYLQVELEVVAENRAAVKLYEKLGFVEFGRNPLGFITRDGKKQELIYMRLEINQEERR